MKLGKSDMDLIRYADIVNDKSSYMYGYFKLPGVLTNDLANNTDYISDD